MNVHDTAHRICAFRTSILLALLCLLTACQDAPTRPPPARFNAAQIAELKHQGFYETPAGWEFDGFDKVLFGINVAELSPEGRKIVERIGRGLLSVGIRQAQLDGFTDNTGQPDYNLKLSRLRAETVASGLSAAGMKPENLHVQGLGEGEPVTSNQTAEGRAQNRRVAIIISSP